MTGSQANLLNVWAEATDIVASALPDTKVSFEWPGMITVRTDADTLLVYGTANETINANVNRLDGDTWQPDESTLSDALITDVPSTETDASVIASAIVASVRQWQADRPYADDEWQPSPCCYTADGTDDGPACGKPAIYAHTSPDRDYVDYYCAEHRP